jgi:hypothetical protein
MTFSRTFLLGVEMRFLLEVADPGALGDPGLAVIFLVEAGHDPQQVDLPEPLTPSTPILASG